MLDLIFATLLAQASPSPEPSPEAIASASASVPASGDAMPAQAPRRITIPFGPRRSPIEPSALAPGDALIRNSGSTNTAGYAIVVHSDGTADVTQGGSTTHKTIDAPQAKWLFAKLKAAMPLSAMTGGHCMKSASFGSVTTIVYSGESTPDLSCPGSADVRELARTVNVIVEQLGVSVRPARGLMRL
jgi:hypothetical protein